jgi:hypothetical protein
MAIAPTSLTKRCPFTLTVVAVMLVAAVTTGALWTPLRTSGLADTVAHVLPALEAQRWWTPVTGSVFALVPLQYLLVAGGFLVLVGFAELRLGTRRTGPNPDPLEPLSGATELARRDRFVTRKGGRLQQLQQTRECQDVSVVAGRKARKAQSSLSVTLVMSRSPR